MRTLRFLSSSLVLTCLVCPVVSRANVEVPPAYDARTVGMGSTGVAHVHNGASLYHNPAAMQGVQNGAVTLAFSPFFPQVSAPLAGPETSVKSSRSLFPLFLVGGAYRINQQLAVGLAVYPTLGTGAKYSVPLLGGAKLDATLAAVEMAPGVSYALTDYLAVGASYRVTYMWYTMEQPSVDPTTGAVSSAKADVSGWNFLGVQLGLFARASKTTRLGVTYRNKVTAAMSGKTEMGGQSLNTALDFAAPHAFKLGVAQSLLDERLTLALDFKLSLYHESNKELNPRVDIPGAGTVSTPEKLDWKNTFGVYAGGEYRVSPEGPAVRLGYSVSQSATPGAYAQPILPPPALQHAVHAGAGVSLSKLDLDVGGYYLFSGAHAQPQGSLPVPGDYKLNGILVALSATYRL